MNEPRHTHMKQRWQQLPKGLKILLTIILVLIAASVLFSSGTYIGEHIYRALN